MIQVIAEGGQPRHRRVLVRVPESMPPGETPGVYTGRLRLTSAQGRAAFTSPRCLNRIQAFMTDVAV